MGIVVVDIENDYCNELCYSYQIVREDDDTYSVYRAESILRGSHLGKKFESFEDAMRCLVKGMEDSEYYRLSDPGVMA